MAFGLSAAMGGIISEISFLIVAFVKRQNRWFPVVPKTVDFWTASGSDDAAAVGDCARAFDQQGALRRIRP